MKTEENKENKSNNANLQKTIKLMKAILKSRNTWLFPSARHACISHSARCRLDRLDGRCQLRLPITPDRTNKTKSRLLTEVKMSDWVTAVYERIATVARIEEATCNRWHGKFVCTIDKQNHFLKTATKRNRNAFQLKCGTTKWLLRRNFK